VAWLFLLPILALTLVVPAPLGAAAAAREESRTPPAPVEPSWPPLPAPVDGAVELTLTEFLSRSYYDASNSLEGVPIRMSGFVVGTPEVPEGFLLTRFALACCAADAFPIQIEVRGLEGPVPANDTWMAVTGHWVAPPEDAEGVDRGAALEIETATVIDPPQNPYE
jgi:uncharacterized repeat protein (TIGR03943 family)